MFAALLTVLFFSLSGVSNQRVAFRLGAMRGNLVRLALSSMILAAIVFTLFRGSLVQPVFNWYFLSGIIGFGLGDCALFMSLERIGSRLGVLLTLCLAPLFAIVLEWFWLGNGITWPIFGATTAILIGVAMALRPNRNTPKTERRGSPVVGVIAGIVSGLGQGTGAVVSRRALDVANEIGVEVNGLSAAFQRVLGGLLIAVIVNVLIRIFRKRSAPYGFQSSMSNRALCFWVIAAASFGPVIGVSCFQWALESTPSGIVLAIVAVTPIVMIPLAVIIEKDRPTKLAIVGAVIAVAGVVTLTVLENWESVSSFFTNQ